ncbi:SAM-dependent methyltransferase [Pseudomonas sp. TE3786]
MSEISQLFGARAGAYASFRPHYPAELFSWLAANSPSTERALDIACGSGQASLPLLEHFQQVLACDASLEQLTASSDLAGIQRFAADAQALPLANQSLDLIIVAQALHWFAAPSFFDEVQRLLKPRGLFCAWCYGLMRIDETVDRVINAFYWQTLGGYWPSGRASIDEGYSDISRPFPSVAVPAFAMQARWDFDHLLGYLRTWSACQLWERKNGHDPVSEMAEELQQAWGDIKQPRFINWPLHFLAGSPQHK